MASTQYYTDVQKLYVAYFNRPADLPGLQFWSDIVAKNNGSTTAVSAAFAQSGEYKAVYGNLDAYHAVGVVYQNLFGHSADVPGLTYWANLLISGAITIDKVVTEIAGGAQGTDLVAYNAKVTVATAFTNALTTSESILAYSGNTANVAAKIFLSTITTDAQATAAVVPATLAATIASVTFTAPVVTLAVFTTGVDALVGTAANDVYTGTITADATSTFGGLDSVDGGAGNDAINISDLVGGSGIPTGVTIKNVETINYSSAAAAVVDASKSNVTGLTALNVLKGTTANVKAGAGAAITVTGLTGAATVVGGSAQTVTSTGGMSLSGTAGAIVAVDAAQGIGNTLVVDGSTVSVTGNNTLVSGTNTSGTVGTITVGSTGHLPTGAVTVVTAIAGDKAGNATAGNITVNGGSTVTVTQGVTEALATVSTTPAATTANFTATQGAVAINGGSSTSTVVVNQAVAAAEDDSITARAAVTESGTIKFGAIKSGESVTFDGMTFTAAKDLTAAQIAAAFANLTAGSKQGTAPSTSGIYSGTYGGNWASGAVATDTVTFTSTVAGPVTDITVSNTTPVGVAPVATKVADGVTGVDQNVGTGGIVAGVVTVIDAAYGATTNSINNVTLNSYATGSSIKSDALATLSLANAKDAAVTVYNNTAAALSLNVSGLTATTAGTASTLNLDTAAAKYTSLAIHAGAANSTVNITAAAVQTLTVDGAKSVNLTGSTLSALKTVVITGAAGVTAGAAFTGTNVTDVNAAGSTAAISASIDASKATYEGSAGADSITLTSTTVGKAIVLGAGDDTLTLASGTVSLSAIIDGGAGTDTLRMTATDATAASGTSSFATKFTGFEKLSLTSITSSATIDMANMNNLKYVIAAGSSGINTSEVQTIDFNTSTRTDGTIIVGGIAVAVLAADSAATVASKVATALNGQTLTSPASGGVVTTAYVSGTTLTVTFPNTAGNVSAITIANGTSTITGTPTDVETTQGVVSVGALSLIHVLDGSTLELTAAGAGATVTMNDATGTADTFNIVTKVSTANLNHGTVDVAGVETINLTVTDTAPTDPNTGAATINTSTFTLKDAAAKSLVITGNANLTLNLHASDIALTSIDASAATGKLVIATVAASTAAVTVKGGTAADSLTGNHQGDILQGGAGADTLIVHADLVTLTGGTGADVFNVSFATSNVNAYANITDLTVGDSILLAGSAATFATSKVVLGDTAVFQDFANAAIKQTAAGAVSWFQYAGNTYVIDNVSGNTTEFVNGTDISVKITGAVDLSTSSFSSGSHALLIG